MLGYVKQKIGFARPNNLHQCIISNIISNVKPECRKSGLWCATEATITWINSNDYKLYSSYLKNPIEFYFCDGPEEVFQLYGEYNIKQILPELKERYLYK